MTALRILSAPRRRRRRGQPRAARRARFARDVRGAQDDGRSDAARSRAPAHHLRRELGVDAADGLEHGGESARHAVDPDQGFGRARGSLRERVGRAAQGHRRALDVCCAKSATRRRSRATRNGGSPRSENAPNVDIFTVEVSFAALKDKAERAYVNELPTSFALPAEAVDRLRSAAAKIVLESPELRTR